MKLIDVVDQIKQDGYIDDRGLVCYSNSSITYTKFYVLFTRYITITQKALPNKMILSLQDNLLHIYKSNNKGELLDYYANIDLNTLTFIEYKKRDFVNDVYKFSWHQDNRLDEFYIICNKERDKGKKLFEGIIEYLNNKK